MYTVFSVVLLAALAAGASISSPTDSKTAAPKQKRGFISSYSYPAPLTSAVVAHAPVYSAPAPVYSAPLVAPAPVYHAPLVAHAPASSSYSSVSITHSVPKVAIAHAPIAVAPAPVYHAPLVAHYAAHAPVYTAHAPVYAAHAPVYAEHAPVIAAHAPAFYH